LSKENVNLMREGFAAFARGEVNALAELLDPHVAWQALEDPEPKHGFEGVLESLASWFGTWEEVQVDLEELIDGGEHVVASVKERGRIAGSEREITQCFFQVWTIEGGKIVAFREYKTRKEALDAAGVQAA
jgi:uncharacterized protein